VAHLTPSRDCGVNMSTPRTAINCHRNGQDDQERQHALDECVSVLYRLSPAVALVVPREVLAVRVEAFIEGLERGAQPDKEEE
jgi:hypothetical protein